MKTLNYIVGLTGGIGSGKTAVANCFLALGVDVVDTDVIARQLTSAGGEAIPAIREAFGQAVLATDGSLDRDRMRTLTFSDPAVKQRLEAILHPMIRKHGHARCQRETQAPYVMLVVPLLVESGIYREAVNRILLVDCDEPLQITRVMQRSHLSAAQVKAVMANQASRAERLAVADDVIVNDQTVDCLEQKVATLHRKYLALVEQYRNLSMRS